jgi:D-alanyl-D-alanine carboxypeptidase
MLVPRIYRPRSRRRFLLAVSFLTILFLAGGLFAALYNRPSAVEMALVPRQPNSLSDPAPVPQKLPSTVQQGLPRGLPLAAVMPAPEMLLGGKLMLIDQSHPIPKEALPPNTLSIADLGAGKIAVRTVQHATDEEVIYALAELCTKGRSSGFSDWLVWEGSRSNAQQLEKQLERTGLHAQNMPLVEAAEQAAREVPAPGTSEHQLPYVVDIRLAAGWNAMPESAPLESSKSGRFLLDTAWQYGFIHRYGSKPPAPYTDEAYHFRFVGVAHSTLMHALNIRLPEYLALLHDKGTLTYYEEGVPRYAVICKKAAENVSFSLPKGCTWEGSIDNMGYVVVAVTFPREGE